MTQPPSPRPVPFRHTKIIATLGPASDAPGVLEAMVEAGLDVARLNCSHGTAQDHAARAAALREVTDRAGRPVPLLVDIRGPKMRVANDQRTRTLHAGDRVLVVTDTEGVDPPHTSVPVSFDVGQVGLAPGHRILLDDGRIKLETIEVTSDVVHALVVRGGELGPAKGVNLPDTDVAIPALSDKDRDDLVMAARIGADWVAVSFVSGAADIRQVRELLPEGVHVIAKIERPAAVANYDEILLEADAVMVARGDLGVETPFEQLPTLQKDLIARANLFGVPVVTATEMLESMTTSSRATRAEITDVANAALDGSDCVMLSGETARGVDPAGAVETMAATLTAVEASEHFRRSVTGRRSSTQEHPNTAVLAAAATTIAAELFIDTIAVFTESGLSARTIAQSRPRAQVVAFATDRDVWRRLALYWGVRPVLLDRADSVDSMVAAAKELLVTGSLAQRGDRIVVVAGAPNKAGSVNSVSLDVV